MSIKIKFSYLERQRDWPYEARQPNFLVKVLIPAAFNSMLTDKRSRNAAIPTSLSVIEKFFITSNHISQREEQKMKRVFKSILLVIAGAALLALTACGGSSDKNALSTKKITIGVTGGPHQQLIEQVKKLAKKDGIDITIKTFDDYNTPNTALNDGDIDTNSYQTIPFLNQQKKDKGYKLSIAFKTVAFPMGIYSKDIKNVKALKKGDKIAVPNDPANEYRALKLFEKAGVIKLKKGVSQKATKNDVAENPLKLKIVELEASQLPSQLSEVTAAAINTNYAMGANLTINDDAIYHEPIKNNPYPNVFVVRTENKDDKIVKKLKKYYQSKEIKAYIKKEFKGSVVPAF